MAAFAVGAAALLCGTIREHVHGFAPAIAPQYSLLNAKLAALLQICVMEASLAASLMQICVSSKKLCVLFFYTPHRDHGAAAARIRAAGSSLSTLMNPGSRAIGPEPRSPSVTGRTLRV